MCDLPRCDDLVAHIFRLMGRVEEEGTPCEIWDSHINLGGSGAQDGMASTMALPNDIDGDDDTTVRHSRYRL